MIVIVGWPGPGDQYGGGDSACRSSWSSASGVDVAASGQALRYRARTALQVVGPRWASHRRPHRGHAAADLGLAHAGSCC